MQKHLKVLMIAASLNYRIRGGLSRHTYELCKALSKLGCRIQVFCMDKPENREVNVDNKFPVSCISAPFFDLVSFNINMLRKIQHHDVDVVHSQAGHGFIFGLAKKRPLVVTVHGTSIRILRSVPALQHHIVPYATVLMERYTFAKADKIIAVSKSVARNLSTDYGLKKERIAFIPHGVDTEKFNPNLNGELVRTKYNVEGPLLLCVSRLRPERFVQRLIPMLNNVVKEIPNARLIIVGEGSSRSYLERLRNQHELTKNIIFAGAHDNDLPYFYAAADLYILPGIHPPAMKEMTVLEAMASGKVVIYVSRINRNSGYSSETEEGIHNNSVIAVNNNKEFASRAICLLQNEKKRKALGSTARRFAIANFSWEKVAEKTISIYKSLL